MRAIACAVATAILLQGCANYRPLIDTRGVDLNRYEQDLGDCQRYAATQDPAGSAAIGAVLGGLLGLGLAVAGGSRYDEGAAARIGAVVGGVSGLAHGAESQTDIIKNCLRGRGYSVLH